MDSHDHEKKLERLSRAITDAILRSKDVRGAFLDLQREGVIGSKSFIMLVMRMDSLADLADSIRENEGKTPRPSGRNDAQYIDGRRLSASEIKFCEYLASKFDEAEWLRQHGLRLN